MPVHDWTLVEGGIFHDFHTGWIPAIRAALNDGLLPSGYYALAEQHAGKAIADVLTLHASGADSGEHQFLPLPPATGGTAVAEAPPRVQRKQTVEQASLLQRRRTIAIRHASGHRLVALLEILSPGNKDRPAHIGEFVRKAMDALEVGVHLLVVDLFPPGKHDPYGIHGEILRELQQCDDPYDLPAAAPLTMASYASQPMVDIYLEHFSVGSTLAAMPLFLRPDRYINVPLEATYVSAFSGMPKIWRDVLYGNGKT